MKSVYISIYYTLRYIIIYYYYSKLLLLLKRTICNLKYVNQKLGLCIGTYYIKTEIQNEISNNFVLYILFYLYVNIKYY